MTTKMAEVDAAVVTREETIASVSLKKFQVSFSICSLYLANHD